MEYNSENFMRWMYEATPEDKRLYDKVMEFSEYFENMLFEAEQEELQNLSIPEKLECFGYSYFTYKVTELPNHVGGRYDAEKQELSIDVQYAEDDNVILHEMIHLHEDVLRDLPAYYYDKLVWTLYQNLKLRISELDKMISTYLEWVNLQAMENLGGVHNLVFFLKSLELDIMLGNPLGTVMGYDGAEMFNNYEYL